MSGDAVISAVISSVLTGGFLLGLAQTIRAVRGMRAGSLSNTGTVIRQLGDENERLAREEDRLREELASARRALWMEQERSARYRLQLVNNGITPYDDEAGHA